MKSMQSRAVVAALALALTAGHAAVAAAQDGAGSAAEISVLGGFQILNQNDTALPDEFVNIPAVASVGWWLSPVFAAEGEFSWLIPIERGVRVGTGPEQDLKTPDVIAYQANLRAHLPGAAPWSPYVAGGLGALTVLSNTDADRLPQVDESQTMFALNFGGGLRYSLNSRWALRADFREFVAFPSDDAHGLSNAGGADPIWMERGTVGLGYRF